MHHCLLRCRHDAHAGGALLVSSGQGDLQIVLPTNSPPESILVSPVIFPLRTTPPLHSLRAFKICAAWLSPDTGDTVREGWDGSQVAEGGYTDVCSACVHG